MLNLLPNCFVAYFQTNVEILIYSPTDVSGRGPEPGPWALGPGLGPIWVRLGPLGPVWVHLGPFGSFGLSLGPGPRPWSHLGQRGPV